MLESLRLERFKNFRDATLTLGPLTVLVGANASGKSNLRDAFRFIHGIARGYSLAETIGEKFVEGGVLQWKGLRGGNPRGRVVRRKRLRPHHDADADDIGRTLRIPSRPEASH